jgi:hypothetical protein
MNIIERITKWVIYAYYFLVTDFPTWLNCIESELHKTPIKED